MKTSKIIALLCVLAIAMMLVAGCAKRSQEQKDEEDLNGDEFDEVSSGIDDDTEDVDAVGEEVTDTDSENASSPASSAPIRTAPARTETSAKDIGVKKITVTEGELVSVDVKGTDPDGDPLIYTFTKPLNPQGKWQTKRGDAGVYHADVTATDGKSSITKTIEIEVLKSNQPPEMERLADIAVEEGDTVTIDPTISDPDGDRLKTTYAGWMTSSTKTTGFDDAGVYTVTITATDGEYEVSQDVRVTVNDVNRAPDFDIVLQ